MILCLSEYYVYLKNASVCNMINEDVSMFRSQCFKKGDYVKGVLTYTDTYNLNE